MRERKYRGYRFDIGWKYGYYYVLKDKHYIRPSDEQYISYGVDPESVGEFTGLLDKNRNEEYEGDIVCSEDSGIYLIVWVDTWAGYFRKVIYPSLYEPNGSELQPLRSSSPIEVIGNRFKHPELLEVSR